MGCDAMTQEREFAVKLSVCLSVFAFGFLAWAETEIAPAFPWDKGAPHINAPSRFGATSWKDFTYTFPVRGAREGMRYSLAGTLPAGVSFDKTKGRLSGRGVSGVYPLVFTAANGEGRDSKPFELVIGEGCLALTPPLGWCSWNAFHGSVSQRTVLEMAHLMVTNGLAARGYAYVNIDAGWAEYLPDGTSARREEGLLSNSRFPDMRAMTDEIHALGLKCGIYSSPMTRTWGGDIAMPKKGPARAYPGSTGVPVDTNHVCFAAPFGLKVGGIGSRHYEGPDARRWAEWGFDFLKYDWSTTRPGLCRMMREALDATGRDFLMQCCTWCQLEDAEDYRGVGQLLRGNNDISARWHFAEHPDRGLDHISRMADKWADKIGPGMWYDLDMLGVGRTTKEWKVHFTRDEQIFHFVYWAFFPAPLFISCDLNVFDGFLLDLACNEELLAVNQDAAGRGPSIKDRQDGVRILRRVLADGRQAVALFNYAGEERVVLSSEVGAEDVRDILACRNVSIAGGVRIASHATRVFAYSVAPQGARTRRQ